MPHDLPTVNQAHRLMDQAESLARQTYLDQGLPEMAQAVEKSVPEPTFMLRRNDPKCPSSKGAPMSETSEGVYLALFSFFTLVMVFLAFGFGHDKPQDSASEPTPAARVPLTDEQAVDWVRNLAANASSAQVEGALAGQPQTIQIWDNGADRKQEAPRFQDPLIAADMADLLRRGKLTSVDREGRPELTWSDVSGPVCHALVQDIYEGASTHGVVVTIDGKDRSVSCAGDHHAIVFSPHL